jgi:hypothetical protein
VLKALYFSAPGVPVVGLLQARRERKRGFQVPGVVAEDIVGGLESKCVAQPASCCILLGSVVHVVCCVRPLRQGGSPSFYRPRRERITCAPHYLAT